MGYAPDWNKGSMKKSGATPVKHGIVSRELFHGAKKAVQNFKDGSPGGVSDLDGTGVQYADPAAAAGPAVEYNIRGQKVGQYEGNDEIAKYRMNMTDGVGGKSLRYKDNPDAKPMPEKRPYDSIDAILDDKSSYGKKAKDKNLVGDVIKAVKDANKPKAVSAPKASAPKAKPSIPEFSDDARSPDQVAPSIPEFSDDARSPDQVAEPYRPPMHNEAEGSYDHLRAPKKEAGYRGSNRARANRSDLSLNLSAQNPELAKKLNMYYGKK